jgi:hypothetical protein
MYHHHHPTTTPEQIEPTQVPVITIIAEALLNLWQQRHRKRCVVEGGGEEGGGGGGAKSVDSIISAPTLSIEHCIQLLEHVNIARLTVACVHSIGELLQAQCMVFPCIPVVNGGAADELPHPTPSPLLLAAARRGWRRSCCTGQSHKLRCRSSRLASNVRVRGNRC